MNIDAIVNEVPYQDPCAVYRKMSDGGKAISLLLESRSKDPRYGKQSIIISDPSVKIIGKGNQFEFSALNETGDFILAALKPEIARAGVLLRDETSYFSGVVIPDERVKLSEHERIRKPSLATILRATINTLQSSDEHAGLYGAFSYDFVRQFETIGDRFAEGSEPDFTLFIPYAALVFDEVQQKAFFKQYVFDGNIIGHQETRPFTIQPHYTFHPEPQLASDMTEAEYVTKVERLVSEIKRGELIQCVLSRTTSMNLREPPLDSYQTLRRINPSPYSFFFNFGEGDYLFGASPELHVKVSGTNVEIRPLAGTIARNGNAIDHHAARMRLLNDEKELREHTMLVDLARNDLARVCDGVNVYEFIAIEEYPNLYHLGSGVTGTTKQGIDSLDCLLATLPAGTLSGAPKVRAMQFIEELEQSRRGYYGGAVGYLGFNGDCNTGITIRSIYVHEGRAYVRSGAGIVHHSIPEKELLEVTLKNANQLRAIGGGAQ